MLAVFKDLRQDGEKWWKSGSQDAYLFQNARRDIWQWNWLITLADVYNGRVLGDRIRRVTRERL